MRSLFLLILIIIFGFTVRIFQINELPGEWFGDISNVHEYVTDILQGRWPFYFLQSPGPVYHYFIIPIVLFFRNQGYETYKVASLTVSLGGVYFIYLFAKESAGKKIALITSLICCFSFWYVVWSRLGNSQIIIPGLFAYSSYYLIRYLNFSRISDMAKSILAASLGWYTYPQTFIIPPLFFIFLLVNLIIRRKGRELFRHLKILFMVTLAGMLFLIPIVKNQNKNMAGNFSSEGYVGEKIMPVLKMSGREFWGKLGNNLIKTYSMLHFSGDKTFRVNAAGKTQIDRLSGMFFILGLIYSIRKFRPVLSVFIIMSLLVLPLPSVSPAIQTAEIPNSARTIAIIPVVYLLVGCGIWQVFCLFKKYYKYSSAAILTGVIIAVIGWINLTDYFYAYRKGLPDNNLGPSRLIASYLDRNLPGNYALYFGSCCWGEWGEPEPKAIAYQLRKKRKFVEYGHYLESCREVKHLPAAVVIGPDDRPLANKYLLCFSDIGIRKVSKQKGDVIFNLMLIRK